MNIFKNWFSKKKLEQPEPKKGQLWLMDDAIVDKYCTPILLTVHRVVDGVVYFSSNYGVHNKEPVTSFKLKYTCQNA